VLSGSGAGKPSLSIIVLHETSSHTLRIRSICPGLQFADASVWLAIATALAVFHVSKVVEGGVEVTPSVRYSDAVISHPESFKCSIKARSAQAEALILQS